MKGHAGDKEGIDRDEPRNEHLIEKYVQRSRWKKSIRRGRRKEKLCKQMQEEQSEISIGIWATVDILQNAEFCLLWWKLGAYIGARGFRSMGVLRLWAYVARQYSDLICFDLERDQRKSSLGEKFPIRRILASFSGFKWKAWKNIRKIDVFKNQFEFSCIY